MPRDDVVLLRQQLCLHGREEAALGSGRSRVVGDGRGEAIGRGCGRGEDEECEELHRVAAMASCRVPGSVDGRLRGSDGGLRARPGYAPQRHDSFNRLQSCGLAARLVPLNRLKGGWQIKSDDQAVARPFNALWQRYVRERAGSCPS